MKSGFDLHVQPQTRFLEKEAVTVLHEAALEILEKTGVLVHHEEAVGLLAAAGCPVTDRNRVRIPSHLVEEAIASAPEKITIYDRQGEPAMLLQDRNAYWGTGSDTPFILDSFTNQRRKTCLKDIEQVSILVDYLDNMDFLMCMGVAHELPQTIADKIHFLTMVTNTRKPLVFTASSLENLSDIHQMACEVSGGADRLEQKPFLIHYTEPIAPLIHPRDSLEKMLFCVEKGIPVIYTSATTAGQNGPATLAGALAMSNARILSGVVIGQLKRKGAKMIVTMHASSMDPRNAVHTYASPEHVICQGAARDLASHYGLPTFGRAGCTDSKTLDQQAAFEEGYEILTHALTGENLIHDVGYIESGLTASWDAIVMCNEFIGAAKRVARGFQLNPETLALDLIDRMGPAGHFLAEPHTVKHFRNEFWIPELIDRDNLHTWEEKGKKTLLDRVKEKIKHILATHKPEPLDPELVQRLEALANTDHSVRK
ncbi:MAG: trimethylamine methyltransferase family protein [Candidatus Latescibacterota bacterium]